MSDKQLTCAERVEGHWASRLTDLHAYYSDNEVYENGSEELGIGPFHEYGLFFDYVAPGSFRDQREGYWRHQFSEDGLSDQVRFYGRDQALLLRAEYWFDGAHIDVTHEAAVCWVFDLFAELGSLENSYAEAMKDWMQPDWWNDADGEDGE